MIIVAVANRRREGTTHSVDSELADFGDLLSEHDDARRLGELGLRNVDLAEDRDCWRIRIFGCCRAWSISNVAGPSSRWPRTVTPPRATSTLHLDVDVVQLRRWTRQPLSQPMRARGSA